MRPSARFTCPYPIQIGAQSISSPMSRILELNLILMICLRNFAPLHVLLRLSSKIPMLALAQETLLSYPIASIGARSRFRIHYTNTRGQSPWRKQIFSRGLVLCRRLGWTLLIFGLSKELMASLERPRRRRHPFDSEPFSLMATLIMRDWSGARISKPSQLKPKLEQRRTLVAFRRPIN